MAWNLRAFWGQSKRCEEFSHKKHKKHKKHKRHKRHERGTTGDSQFKGESRIKTNTAHPTG